MRSVSSLLQHHSRCCWETRISVPFLSDALGRQDLEVVRSRAKPTMIIVPEHDRLVNVERLRQMVAPLDNVQLVVDDQGGHGWSPDAVVRHLAAMRGALAS